MKINVFVSHWFPHDADLEVNPQSFLFIMVPQINNVLGRFSLQSFLRDCTAEKLATHSLIVSCFEDGLKGVLLQLDRAGNKEVHVIEYRKPMEVVLATDKIDSNALLEHLKKDLAAYKGRPGKNYILAFKDQEEPTADSSAASSSNCNFSV